MNVHSLLFVNRYVFILFAVQIMGWVGLVATFDHTPGTVVGWVQTLPTPVRILLLPLAIFSIPALAVALGIGWILTYGGLPPETIPSLFIAQGDVLVLASAYAVAVGGAWGISRITKLEARMPLPPRASREGMNRRTPVQTIKSTHL